MKSKSNIIMSIDPATKTDYGCELLARIEKDGSLTIIRERKLPKTSK